MITLQDLTISYGDKDIISDLSLEIDSGEFLTLLGSSGSGKSTLFRAIAGFVPVRRGRILVDGIDVTHLPAEKRNLGFVFQSYALFPHLSVEKNIAFGLAAKGTKKAEIGPRVDRVLETTGLEEYRRKAPAELSGGQQQRVAIARVLVTEPSVILMDEPLSNLDSTLRAQMRSEIRRIHIDQGVTTVYVTHDQEEALAMSDRVALLREGKFLQLDSPHAIYHHPSTPDVCRFIGESTELSPAASSAFGLGAQRVFLRPERIRINARGDREADGIIEHCTFNGMTTEYLVRVSDCLIKVSVASQAQGSLPEGASVLLTFLRDDVIGFDR